MASTARCTEDEKEFFDSPEELKKKVKLLAQYIKKSKHMIAFTGAGISTSAGIPDYRSGINTSLGTGGGKWAREAAAKKGITVIPEPKDAKAKNKSRVIKAVPTKTHMTLVKLAQDDILKCLISQNTDGLHRKSNFPILKLAELHGNGNLEVCGLCGKQYLRDYRTRNRKLARSRPECTRKMPKREKYGRKKHFTGRYCAVENCKGRLYDTIINFSESLPTGVLGFAEEQTKKADFCLAMGSSLTVTPAADLPEEVGEHTHIKNSALCIINIQKTPLEDCCQLRIFGKTDEVMVMLMKELKIDIPSWRLERYVKIDIKSKEPGAYEKDEGRQIVIMGIDRDGTRYDIFSECKFECDEKEFVQKSKNKKVAMEYITFITDSWSKNGKKIFNFSFMGHYREPDFKLDLGLFIKNFEKKKNSLILKLEYCPFKREWYLSRKLVKQDEMEKKRDDDEDESDEDEEKGDE